MVWDCIPLGIIAELKFENMCMAMVKSVINISVYSLHGNLDNLVPGVY